MWGRANMAAVTLLILLGWFCILAQADAARTKHTQRSSSSNNNDDDVVNNNNNDDDMDDDDDGDDDDILDKSTNINPDGRLMLERASNWLWSRRDRDAGWGNDTQLVLLALRLANLSKDENLPTPASLELQLSTKQMEIEIVLMMWRHREIGGSPVRLALYTLALNAMCMDPRQFHGHDLIGSLLHHEPAMDYDFALTALAACNAQAHSRKRQMRRLLDIAHAAQTYKVDTVAMGIMTLRCIVQDHRHRNLQHFVRKPSLNLAQRQRRDGSFGDIRNTALAMQALEEVENEPLDNWNRTAALAWLAARQRSDGSFEGDVKVTAEVVLGLAPRPLASIRTLDCGQGFADSSPPRIANVNVGETPLPVNRNTGPSSPVLPTASSSQSSFVSSSSSSLISTTTSKTSNPMNSSPTPIINFGDDEISTQTTKFSISQQTAPMVKVTYTLWVGSDVDNIYNITITAPKNETFYEVMVLAAQRSANFQFSAYEWPNGHYVHTLAGFKEEPMSYHYWLLYRLPSPPEPSSPPGNQLVAPGGVDDLQISDGEHYLFWYKKL